MSNEIGEKLSSAMAGKMCKAVEDMEIEINSVYINGLSEDITAVLTDAFKSEDVKKAIQEKLVETIKAIDPEIAAKKLEMTWGELIGEFLYKIVNSFKAKK